MRTSNALTERILEHGLAIASRQGLHALSIGEVARDLDLSRRGVVQSFADKETLQLKVLQQATDRFLRTVVEVDDSHQTGDGALRALFRRWIAWSRAPSLSGGCPFVHASREQDILPAPVGQHLKSMLEAWSEVLDEAIRYAQKSGALSSDLDRDQLIFELYGLYLSHHFWHWSMKDKDAAARTMTAFERLLAASR
jgi:AcrR family transcriptional regulator